MKRIIALTLILCCFSFNFCFANDELDAGDVDEPQTTQATAEDNEEEESERTVLFVSAHQDDETLSGISIILDHLKKGDDVYVMLVSNGANSVYREKTSYSKSQFTAVRDREFKSALGAMGVKSDHIIIPSSRTEDGKASQETSKIRTMLTDFCSNHDNILLYTNSPEVYGVSSVHADHVAIGGVASDLYKQGYFDEYRCYIDPYFINKFSMYQHDFHTVRTTNKAVVNKCYDAYVEIGRHSVPNYFAGLMKDPVNYYYIYRGDKVVRFAGATRYETASLSAEYFVSKSAPSGLSVGLTTGQNYADGLSAGPIVGQRGGVLLLIDDDKSYSFGYVRDFMCEHEIGEVMIFGGTDVLSKKLENGIVLLVSE